jgi:hypothetical protein
MAIVEQTVALAEGEVVDVMRRPAIQKQVTRTFLSTRVPAAFSGLRTMVVLSLTPRYCVFLWDETGGDGLICVFGNLPLGGNNLILKLPE